MTEKYNILISVYFRSTQRRRRNHGSPSTTHQRWRQGKHLTFASTNGENQGKIPTIQGQQKDNDARFIAAKHIPLQLNGGIRTIRGKLYLSEEVASNTTKARKL